MAKVHVVILNTQAIPHLDSLVAPFMHTDEVRAYFYAESYVQDGAFLNMRLNHKLPNDTVTDVDLAIPIQFVNCIFGSADVKKLGFV